MKSRLIGEVNGPEEVRGGKPACTILNADNGIGASENASREVHISK